MLKSLKFYWPFVSCAVLLAATSLYFGRFDEPDCTVILGYSATLWSLIVFCFGFPFLVVVASIYLLYAGWHAIKQGVYPPTNFPSMGMKTRTGWVARAQALVALLFPLLAIGIVVLGTHTFNEILGGDTAQAFQLKLIGECI